MDRLLRYKGTIIGALFLAGIFWGYAAFVQGTSIDPLSSSTALRGQNAVGISAGQEIVAILEEIKSIKLETELLRNPDFLGFTDYRTALPSKSVGRVNPFEPVGFGLNLQGRFADPTELEVQSLDAEPSSKNEIKIPQDTGEPQ